MALLDHILLVALEEFLRPQRRLQLVHEILRNLVVHVVDAKCSLDRLDTFVGGSNCSLLFVDVVVNVAFQASDNRSELVIDLRGVGDAARNNEWSSRFVNEDRVDFVDDAIEATALHLLGTTHGHVVAQVIETKLIVRSVGDIARILRPLHNGVVHARDDKTYREPKAAMDSAHPVRVSGGEVVVDRHHVHALASKSIEVHRKG